jgi:hypothetical protein
MNERSAEEAAHAHARAAVTGDIGTYVRGMTPDALAKAMAVGNTNWDVLSHEIESQRRDGDDYVFDICYRSKLEPLTMRERFRNIDGAWKLVDIERIG